MAEPNQTFRHIRVEHDEMPERVIHVGAEGVRMADQDLVPESTANPAHDEAAPAPAAAVEQLPVESPTDEEPPEVPLPKMHIGVLVFVALLVVVCVLWYLTM